MVSTVFYIFHRLRIHNEPNMLCLATDTLVPSPQILYLPRNNVDIVFITQKLNRSIVKLLIDARLFIVYR